jgi:hypothetical protein
MRTGIPPFFFCGGFHGRKNDFVVNQGLKRACLEGAFLGEKSASISSFFSR